MTPAAGDAAASPAPAEVATVRTRHPDAVAFRRAATALAAASPDSDEGRRHAADAARHLIALGTAGDDHALRAILRPDPDAAAVAWTVACYQIGDLTPSALRDFADPVEAVATLASCEEASHLASELMASTDDGIRWTAMSRTGDEARFQLLASATCSGDPTGARLAHLRAVWADQLVRWAAAPDQDPLPPPRAAEVVAPSGLIPDRADWTQIPPFPTGEAIDEIVTRVVDAVRAADLAVAPDVLERLAAIEARLDEVNRSLVALRSQSQAPELAANPWMRRLGRLRRLRATMAVHVQLDDAPGSRAVAIDATSTD